MNGRRVGKGLTRRNALIEVWSGGSTHITRTGRHMDETDEGRLFVYMSLFHVPIKARRCGERIVSIGFA